MTKAFISYSWDSDEHKVWVAELAARLHRDGVEVILDQWHLIPGDQLPLFMEIAVRDSDYVLIVCTPRYKVRSDSRSGGVGYEGDIMSGEVLTQGNQRKFIPILRQSPWSTAAPSWLSGKYYINLSDTPYSNAHYQDLLTTLLGTRPSSPPVGKTDITHQPPSDLVKSTQPSDPVSSFEPIKILEVIVDEIGTPRNDGTRGSALYDVPFRLTRRAPPEWAQLFVALWDHPPRFTTMHRPNIASIVGSTIHLNGTTIEEVQRYHRDTLNLVSEETNKKYLELLIRHQQEQELEHQRIEEHKHNVEDVAKHIKFDEQ